MKYSKICLRESTLKADFLKAVANAPKNGESIEAVYNCADGKFCFQILRFDNVSDWMSSGDFGAEDCFWAGINSKMPPSKEDEYVLYDVFNNEIIGIDNRNFTMAKFAKMLNKAGFTIFDEEEAENFIETYL